MLSSTQLLEFANSHGIPVWALDASIAAVLAVVLFAICGVSVIVNVYILRKSAGDFQLRYGPMHVGWHGTLQLFADAIKLITKEDIFPASADRWIFRLAPVVTFVPVYLGFLVLPIGKGMVIQDLNVGLLYIFAIPAIGVAGIIMAGFGSYNKYAMIGSLRSAAQMVSYEVPRALSIIGIVMIAGSAKLSSIVGAQHLWYIILQPVAFVVFMVSTLAEINSTPFDLPETESELVNGYYTEYSGTRFMFFFFAEYVALFAAATLTTVLFLGGWHGPGPDFLGPIWFTIKTFAMVFVIMWIKWTLPRFRIDQVMDLGWKVLLPIALVNVLVTGLVIMLIQ